MRGLNKLYWLKIDIENIKKEIANIEAEKRSLPTISSPQLDGMPRGTGISNPTVNYVIKKEALEEKLKELERVLEDKLSQMVAEEQRLRGIIEQIDDPKIKTMADMRFVQNKTWEEIGQATNYDRTSCAKILKKYFKEGEQND